MIRRCRVAAKLMGARWRTAVWRHRIDRAVRRQERRA
jgi:TolB-like protein